MQSKTKIRYLPILYIIFSLPPFFKVQPDKSDTCPEEFEKRSGRDFVRK